jgi:hypothetical protein
MTSKPQLNIKKLYLSKHAIERAKERYNLNSEVEASKYIKERIGNSKFIGEVACEQGGNSYMYVYDRKTAIYVSTDLQVIKTILDLEDQGHYVGLRSKIESMYQKEFRKVDRLEKARLNKLKLLELKNGAEVAVLKLRIFKTRSQNVKNECLLMIDSLQNEIEQCRNEIEQAKIHKRQIAKAIATRY